MCGLPPPGCPLQELRYGLRGRRCVECAARNFPSNPPPVHHRDQSHNRGLRARSRELFRGRLRCCGKALRQSAPAWSRRLREWLVAGLLSRLSRGLAHLLASWLTSLLGRGLITLLRRAETALGQLIGRKLAHAIVGTDLIKEALIGDFVFGDVISAIAKLAHDLRFRFREHVRIFLENLDNLIGREL